MADVTPNTKNNELAIASFLKDHLTPQLVTVTGQDGTPTQVLITPQGLKSQSVKPFLDEYRTAPERRRGTATLTDLPSFIAHVNRFKDEDSALFANADPQKPGLVAVLDYHRAGADGAPRFGQHRASYAFPLSDEWKAWFQANGLKMTQGDFAAFLEDRIGDIAAPPVDGEEATPAAKLAQLLGGKFASPQRLMDLSRGLSVRVDEKVAQVANLQTGEANIQFTTQHSDENGQPLKVPSLFLVTIPVFKSGAPYQLAVRLRYRVSHGSVSWFFELHRPDRVFEHAFNEACEKAGNETGLPLYQGHPEA